VRVVVDTNVWVSALIRPAGAPGRVLAPLARRRDVPVASWALAAEIAAVLRRPRIRRYGIGEEDVRDVLRVLAPFLPDVDTGVALRDPGDLPVVASALAGGAEAIVTGDRDLLEDRELRALLAERGIRVLTPRAYLDLPGA
jgi:hypothetical protein